MIKKWAENWKLVRKLNRNAGDVENPNDVYTRTDATRPSPMKTDNL